MGFGTWDFAGAQNPTPAPPLIYSRVPPRLRRRGSESDILRVNPDIARALKEEERALLRDLESTPGKKVTIRPDAHLHHEQFDVMAI